MPAKYKYGFLPDNRGRALDAALAEFYDCKKQANKLREDLQALNERIEFIGALLEFGVGQVMPDGEMRKRVEAVVGDS
jgi:hypothetical protein